MPDYYHAPALLLTGLLLPAFGYLYLRSRDARTLLWFLGFLFAIVNMLLTYKLGWLNLSPESHPWVMAAALSCGLISSALFFGSLSPVRFRIGKIHMLYVIPFTAPLVAYILLSAGLFKGIAPAGPLFLIFPGLGIISLVVAFCWVRAKGALPLWIGVPVCLGFGGAALYLCCKLHLLPPIIVVETGNHVVTAILLAFVYRRISPGVALSVMGFSAWSLTSLELLPSVGRDPFLDLNLVHLIVMGRVIAALGLILLALENELAVNKAAGERERFARRELEAYTNLVLSRRRVEDFDRQAAEVCETVAANSRFSQAALILLQDTGHFYLAGAAGFDTATTRALENLVERIPVAGFLAAGTATPAAENSHTMHLELEPLLQPGDDLKRLQFTSAFAVPMQGLTTVEGALLLAGVRPRGQWNGLRTDDLVPVETLTARLQFVRSQTRMLEKLIDAEKFAGLGQLAGHVTQQLNNPLTVILGYASLLEDMPHLDAQGRKGIEAILTEARHMRATLGSLSRIARAPTAQLATISVSEMLEDLEQLHRSEFQHRSIEFRLNIAPDLPRVLCQAQQLRQAVLHCLQFAMEAAENVPEASERSVRLEASAESGHVQILVAHTGAGFEHPERAFDAYVPPQAGAETAGLGLSLCATILRDNNGHASAVNLEPRGAAIVLDLQAA
jgi:signal transduction histidine kinase